MDLSLFILIGVCFFRQQQNQWSHKWTRRVTCKNSTTQQQLRRRLNKKSKNWFSKDILVLIYYVILNDLGYEKNYEIINILSPPSFKYIVYCFILELFITIKLINFTFLLSFKINYKSFIIWNFFYYWNKKKLIRLLIKHLK